MVRFVRNIKIKGKIVHNLSEINMRHVFQRCIALYVENVYIVVVYPILMVIKVINIGRMIMFVKSMAKLYLSLFGKLTNAIKNELMLIK